MKETEDKETHKEIRQRQCQMNSNQEILFWL